MKVILHALFLCLMIVVTMIVLFPVHLFALLHHSYSDILDATRDYLCGMFGYID